MIKKLISLSVVTLMLLSCFGGISAFAAMDDAPAAELVFQSDKPYAEVGELIEVKLFINNISVKDGIIACDLPLFYDKEVLELSYQEAIVPKSWGSSYKFLYDPGTDKDFCWLRVVPDVPIGQPLDFYEFCVTEDNTLGFLLVFTVKKAGATKLQIKHKAEDNVFMMIVSPELENYPPSSSLFEINSDAAGSEDSSIEDSSESEGSSAEESSAEESSEEASSAEESSTIESKPEEESSIVAESSESGDGEASEDASDEVSAGKENTKDNNEGDGDKDGDESNTLTIVLIAIGVLVVIGGVAGYVIVSKKKQKK